MRGWIGGIVLGVALGSAVTGAAQAKGWESAKTILNLPPSTTLTNFIYQTAYASGVSDALYKERMAQTVSRQRLNVPAPPE